MYRRILHLVLSMLALFSFVDNGVALLTSYTEDSGNAIPPVRHCDHNKRNAAAIIQNITIHL